MGAYQCKPTICCESSDAETAPLVMIQQEPLDLHVYPKADRGDDTAVPPCPRDMTTEAAQPTEAVQPEVKPEVLELQPLHEYTDNTAEEVLIGDEALPYSEGQHLRDRHKKGETKQNEETNWVEEFDINEELTLADVPTHLKTNREIVLAAVAANGLNLEHAALRFKDDIKVVTAAVRQNRRALDHASRRLRAHPDILKYLPVRQSTFSEFDPEMLGTASGSKKRRRPKDGPVKSTCIAMCGISEKELRAEWHLRLKNGDPLRAAPERFRNDIKLVLAAVRCDTQNLLDASERVRDDDVFVLSCIQEGLKVFDYASDRLRYDPEMIASHEKAEWVEILLHGGTGAWLNDAPEHLRDDEDVVIAAARRSCHTNLDFASERLMDDPDFVMKIMSLATIPAHVLQYTSARLREDRNVVAQALSASMPEHVALVFDCAPNNCQGWYEDLAKQVEDANVH